MKAFILAGGLGTRLATVAREWPKAMVPIGRKPFLEYLLENLSRQDIREVVLLTGYKEEKIRSHFGNGYANVHIEYSNESKALGTAGAIAQAIKRFSAIGDDVLVLNGDTYFDVPFRCLAEFHKKRKNLVTMALKYQDCTDRYGSVIMEKGLVCCFKEKTAGQGGGIINGGAYIVSREVLDETGNWAGMSIEEDVFPLLAAEGSIGGVLFFGRFIDIGVPEDYEAATQVLDEWIATPKKRVIFLDRDGIINIDRGYTYKTEDLEFVDGCIEFLREARKMNYELVIVTNQAGIAKGEFSEADHANFMAAIISRLGKEGIEILDYLYCPFHPEAKIEKYRKRSFDRKPNPGMILRAAERHFIDLTSSWMVGDKVSDRIELPYLRTLLLRGGHDLGDGLAFNSFESIIEEIKNG
jgi:D,D-heptose 1,7-bisphosphate phosphatase